MTLLHQKRDLGLRTIIVYKFIKAPLMLVLALWLSLSPELAYHVAETWAQELAETGTAWTSLGAWLQAHLSSKVLLGGTILVWLDGCTTAAEGILLLVGKPWGEWLVIVGLCLLLCVEAIALIRHSTLARVLTFGANVLIVIYLVRRRIRTVRRKDHPSSH